MTLATSYLSTVPSAVWMLFLRCAAQYRAQLLFFLWLANAVWTFSQRCSLFCLPVLFLHHGFNFLWTFIPAVPSARNHSSSGLLKCCSFYSIYCCCCSSELLWVSPSASTSALILCLVRFLLLFACAALALIGTPLRTLFLLLLSLLHCVACHQLLSVLERISPVQPLWHNFLQGVASLRRCYVYFNLCTNECLPMLMCVLMIYPSLYLREWTYSVVLYFMRQCSVRAWVHSFMLNSTHNQKNIWIFLCVYGLCSYAMLLTVL